MKKRNAFPALLLSASLALSLPLFADGYWPPAIGDFDGSSDYLRRTSAPTGIADTKNLLFSCWFRIDGGAASTRNIINVQNDRLWIELNAANKVFFKFESTNSAVVYSSATIATYTDSDWHHLAIAIDAANGIDHIYVDDVSAPMGAETRSDNVIDYTIASWAIGGVSSNGQGDEWNGALSEFYLATEFFDISIEANRRRLISAAGNPIFLGTEGSLPTGTASIIYMRERAKNAGINYGTGGDFDIVGAPLYSDGPFPFFPLTIPIPDRGMGSRIH